MPVMLMVVVVLLLPLTLLILCGCGNLVVATVATTPTNPTNPIISTTNNNSNTHKLVKAKTTITTLANNKNSTNNNKNSISNIHVNGNYLKYPCAFIDTVNISADYELQEMPSDKHYVHDALRIPADLVAIYDFVIVNGVRQPSQPHLRACICRVKPCVRYCCASGQRYDLANRTCTSISVAVGSDDGVPAANSSMEPSWHMMLVWHSNANGSIYINTSLHFVVHVGVPCSKMRLITKDNNQLVPWQLYENGSIAYEHHMFSKHYCYTPYPAGNKESANDNNNNNSNSQATTSSASSTPLPSSFGMGQHWEWQPLACAIEKFPFVLGVTEWTYAICLIIAVICMFITLFIHLLCNELRNTFYGVAIKSYTICIIIAYSLLAHLTLNNPAHIGRIRCSNIACCILLFVLLSFLLMCFISFNFYLNYHGITLTKPMFWLILCPIVLLAVGWALYVRFDHFGGKPVFGHDTCWFDPRNFSILAYFYAPILFACLICIFFYTVTLLHISERSASELSKLTTEIEENRFKSFWSFFCYTFVMWLVCLISFAMHNYLGQPTHINYLVCLFIALHGFAALYTLVGKNQQIQNSLRRMESGEDDHNDQDEDNERDEEARAVAAAVLGTHLYDDVFDDELDTDESSSATMRHVPMTHF